MATLNQTTHCMQIAPKPMPARHKTDPFNDKTVHPFTELNLYLNCDELMQVAAALP